MASKKLTATEEFEKGVRDDWSVYVARVAIDIGGARAFNVGDAVPATHVQRGVVSTDDVIERTDDKALGELDSVQATPVPDASNLRGAADAPDEATQAEVDKVYKK